jgi:hypothetical protein
VREQENAYMEEAIWATMDEAREAVCARALALNVQGWMEWAEGTYVPVVPIAQTQDAAATTAVKPQPDACTAIYTELARHGLVPEVKYDKNPLTKRKSRGGNSDSSISGSTHRSIARSQRSHLQCPMPVQPQDRSSRRRVAAGGSARCS